MAQQENKSCRTKYPPGPGGLPVLGKLHEARRDPLSFTLSLMCTYGDIIYFRLGMYRGYLLNRPDLFHHVLYRNYQNYNKDNYNYKKLRTVLGNGLITSGGDNWSYYRNLFNPFFSQKKISDFSAVTKDATTQMLSRWGSFIGGKKSIELASELAQLTLKITAKSFFRIDDRYFASDFRDSFKILNTETAHRFKTLIDIPTWIPTRRNRRFLKARNNLNSLIFHFLKQKHDQEKYESNMLEALFNDEYTNNSQSARIKNIRDHMLTFLLAGHETTASLLTWTCYLLARHPHVLQKFRMELFNVFGSGELDLRDISSLVYCRNVLKESLRLYPPVWIISRRALQDDILDGYRIPAGSTVTLCSYALHRHPDYWEQPESFNPDRFSDSGNKKSTYAYFPFGGGPRSCIGSHFALIESTIILAMIVRRFDMHLVPDHPVEPEALITLQPRYGLKMYLTNTEE
jgi:cytochrome P450